MSYAMKGVYYQHEKKYAESTEFFKRSMERNQNSYLWVYNDILYNYLELEDETSAVETLKNIFSHEPGFQKYENSISPIYETSGITGVLKLYLETILKENKNACPAKLFSILGMKEEALACLEKRCISGISAIPRMIQEPEYESLYSEPRFQALVDTMNLRPYFPTSE